MEKCQNGAWVTWWGARARSHLREKLCNVNLTTIFRSWHSRSTFGCSLETRVTDEATFLSLLFKSSVQFNFHGASENPSSSQEHPSPRHQFLLIISVENKQNRIKIPSFLHSPAVSGSAPLGHSVFVNFNIKRHSSTPLKKMKTFVCIGKARKSFHH